MKPIDEKSQTDIQRKRALKKKNYAILFLLLGFITIFYFVAILKISMIS